MITKFYAKKQDEKWQSRVAADLNCIIAHVSRFDIGAKNSRTDKLFIQAVKRIVHRVAEFESLQERK